jgi:hypothetical protein
VPGTSKLLGHDTYLSAFTSVDTTLVTGDSDVTAHYMYASARRLTDNESPSHDSMSESNESHFTTPSVTSGLIYLPSNDSDNETSVDLDSSSDSTSNSASHHFPLWTFTLPDLEATFNILPSYDIDPFMFIVFEISDPKTKQKEGM